MTDPLINISAALKKTRFERGLTLQETAGLTGVSKAMLGQIERGESTPTISTLWKISTGLKISFSELLQSDKDDKDVIDIEALDPIYESNNDMILYSVFPFDPLTGFEYFYIRLLPGANHVSSAHKMSTTEHVVVTKGKIEVVANDKRYILEAPAAMAFKGDAPHQYNNPFEEEAIFQNIVRY